MQNLIPGPANSILIHHNGQSRNQFQPYGHIRGGDPAAPLRLEQNVADFEKPQPRHQRAVIAHIIQQQISLGRGLIRETPA
jgi:hypothetical protein